VAPLQDLDAEERLMVAGRGRERAAYTAYAIALFELQLAFLETLPEGWFIGSREFEEGTDQLARLTGVEGRSAGDRGDLVEFSADVRAWREWYQRRRPDVGDAQRAQLDPLFIRLSGTTPLLVAPEFRDVVRSVASMSGLPASWQGDEGSELYSNWAAFESDRSTWRRWMETHRDQLEWDVAEHRLRVGRGLGPLVQ
jgi:hypothetical protein